MFKKKQQLSVHCFEISYLGSDDVSFYYDVSADSAISIFLSEHPNVDDDYIVIIDRGVMKDPDDRK